MARALVIYNTVTGFSKTYGEWIAEDLGAECLPWEEAKGRDFAAYDLIVFGAGVRMSIIRGFKEFRAKLKKDGLVARTGQVGAGKVVVWANGGTPQHPERDWKVPSMTFTKQELARRDFPFFYFEGGVRYDGLNFAEEKLLRLFSKRVQKYRGRGEWAEAVADGIVDGYDHTSREAIAPLVAKAKEMLGE